MAPREAGLPGWAGLVLGGALVALLGVVLWLVGEVRAAGREIETLRGELAEARAQVVAEPPARRRPRLLRDADEAKDEPLVLGPRAGAAAPRGELSRRATAFEDEGRRDLLRERAEDFAEARGLSDEDAAAVEDELEGLFVALDEIRDAVASGERARAQGRLDAAAARIAMESALEERLGADGVAALRAELLAP